ncbi:hypothetical protein C8R46DRAFT_1228009 [Mycena filopes]|nr:hypothetical protein C8R46DRAFT_1228009 [Mycena filopes]
MQSPDTLNPSFFISNIHLAEGHWSLAAYPESHLAYLTDYRLSLDQTRRDLLDVSNSCRPNHFENPLSLRNRCVGLARQKIQTGIQKINQHLWRVDNQMQQINQRLWLVKYGMQSLCAYNCSGSPGLPLNPFHPDPQLPSSTHGNYFDRRFPEDSDSPLSARVEELNAEHETHPAPIDLPKLQPGPADIVSAEALPPTEVQPPTEAQLTKNGEELKLDSAIRLVMLRSLGIPFDRNILITVRAEQYTTLVESAAYVNGDNDARQPTLDPMCPCWEDIDNLSTATCTSFSTLPPFPGETIAIASVLAHHSRAPPATSACRDPFRVRNGSSSAQVVSVVLILLQVFTVASFVRLTSPSGLHTSVAVRTLRRHARLGRSSFVRLHLPNEVLSLIIEMLFTTPQNQRDVHESVLIREIILSLSILFHALCLAAPGAWTAVCVELQRSDPSPSQVWAAPEEFPSLAKLDSHLVLSKNRPIHVVFSVPISRQTDDPGRILFRRILSFKDKIESLFFRGSSTCQSSWLCPHAVFSEWPILHNTPSLRIILLDAPFAYRPCSIYHQPVPIRLTDLARLKCPFPTRIVVASTVPPAAPSLLPRLTHIHIDTQTSELWAKVFVSCDALECLQYGPKNSLNTYLPIPPVVTSLRLLRVHRMSCLPPLTAPNLQVLNVLDPNVGLTSAGLSRITGCTTTKIRTLDLLWNFVSNTEMKAILDRCPALQVLHLNADSGNDLRTPIYRELRDRIQLSYLRLGPGRFRAASFSHSPPLNSRAKHARQIFDSLSSIAVVTKDCKIAPYPLIWRVRVLNCQGYFCGDLFSRESYSFLRENGFGQTLVAAEIYETLCGSTTVPSVFSIILAFRERDDAVRAISRGVRQGGSMRQAIQFNTIWDDTVAV